MASYSFNSPNVQGVSTPLSTLSQSSKHSPVQQSPAVSYVVPSNMAPVRVVSSPNFATNGGPTFSASPSPTQDPKTREVSTVYLPPIRYRYDNATGTLVQVSGPSAPNPQVQSPLGAAGQNFTPFDPQFGSYSPNLGPSDNFKSQNVHLFSQSTQPGFSMERFTNLGNPAQSPANQHWPFNFQPTQAQHGPQEGFAFQQGNPAFSNDRVLKPGNLPVFNSGAPYGANPTLGNPQFRGASPGLTNFGFQPNTSLNTPRAFQYENFTNSQGFNSVPTFGHPSSFPNSQVLGPAQGYGNALMFGDHNPFANQGNHGYGNLHNYNNQLYMDTPRARYEAAVKDYYDRMNGNFQNYRPQAESPNGFAQAFATFENVASKFFSGTDGFVSDFKNAAFKMLNPNSPDYHKAAVFTLLRLDGVPVNPKSVSTLSFSVVAYFDPATENYNVHKSDKYWALPTEVSGVVDCDLKGATVKIPWRGEEFVFLKVMEHVGPNRLVLGRLQLKVENLVTGRPLKVTIMGEDGHTKGNAIFEFGVGAVTLEELNQMNMESTRNANYNQDLEDRSRRNMMPDYEGLDHGNNFEKGHKWPKTRLRTKGSRFSNDGGFPGPLKYLASWCCDITDHDLG